MKMEDININNNNISAAAANTNVHQNHFHFPATPNQNTTTNFASSSTPFPQPNPRKKRTKMIKLTTTTTNNNNSLLPTTTTSAHLKPKYTKKPDIAGPSKIPHPCSECGKKFWSWKALFGHMRCHPERQWRGINPPPNLRRPFLPPEVTTTPSSSSNHFQLVMSDDDHEIATCLLMLASGTFLDSESPQLCGTSNNNNITSTSTSMVEWKSLARDVEMGFSDLALIDYQGPSSSSHGNCRFECSSCKKVFGSHQALGGHRASHKNVKGCFAITRSDVDIMEEGECRDGQVEAREHLEDKMMMVYGHRCSICLKVFSSGQALGGHKRCHWEKEEEPQSSSLVEQAAGYDYSLVRPRQQGCGLDLNLPAPLDDNASSSYSCPSGLTLDLRLGL